jgi:hypothetical protein
LVGALDKAQLAHVGHRSAHLNSTRLHVDVVHSQRGSLTETQTAVAEDEDERAHAPRRDGHAEQLLMTQVALLNLWQRRQFDAIGRTG